MKRYIAGLLTGIIITVGIGFSATIIKSVEYNDTQIAVDGQVIPLTNRFVTIINEGEVNGRNYAPLREVLEKLGYTVNWNNPVIEVTSPKTDIEQVAKNVESCVMILIYDNTDMSKARLVATASGVILDNGIIVTNKHVLDSGKMFGIQFNDTPSDLSYKVTEKYYVDTNQDIGFLKSPIPCESVKLGDSSKVSIGQNIITIGSPKGLKNQISEGKITGLSSDADGQSIQINALIKGGSSGSGLFNMKGELIGIVKSSLTENENFSFVIPINDIKPLLEKLE